MSSEALTRAILAMDSYNRGYSAGIILPDAIGTSIGNASIIERANEEISRPAGFYAIAYQLGGQKIISYRGTDDLLGGWRNLFLNGEIISA